MNLGDNFIQEGLVNRITPFTTAAEGAKRFDTERTYDLVMNKFKWGGLNKKGLYLDETITRMCYTHRRLVAQLALQLALEGKKDKALEAMAKVEKEIPEYNVPMNYMSGAADMAQAYTLCDKKQKALQIYDKLWKNSEQYAKWYLSLSDRGFSMSQNDCFMQFQMMMSIMQAVDEIDTKWVDKHEPIAKKLIETYQAKGGNMPE